MSRTINQKRSLHERSTTMARESKGGDQAKRERQDAALVDLRIKIKGAHKTHKPRGGGKKRGVKGKKSRKSRKG